MKKVSLGPLGIHGYPLVFAAGNWDGVTLQPGDERVPASFCNPSPEGGRGRDRSAHFLQESDLIEMYL
jgi:hypothetical protein